MKKSFAIKLKCYAAAAVRTIVPWYCDPIPPESEPIAATNIPEGDRW
jgi:hypothetical protein